MQLFGSTDSGHSFKVRAFLLLARIPHQYHWVDLNLPREARGATFVAASKFGEVPVLLDDGRAYCQSNAILIHLAQKIGQFGGAAHDAAHWPDVLEWLCWESNRIGFSLPNWRYALRHAPQPAQVMDWLRQRVLQDLHTLDQALAQQAFLLPVGPTIADLSCSAYLFWLDQVGIAESNYPHLARWLDALRALPGWIPPDQALQALPPASPAHSHHP